MLPINIENLNIKFPENFPSPYEKLLIRLVDGFFESRKVKKMERISKVISSAVEFLSKDKDVPPEKKVDEGWADQFLEYASLVSDEDLQKLWGQILAGEIKTPGKYSLRTLAFVKNMSKKDAEEIYGVSSFVIKDFIFRNPNNKKSNLSFGAVLYLQELGVIQGVESIGINQTFNSRYTDRLELGITFGNMLFIIKSPEHSKTLIVPAYRITSLGKEVFSLINDVKTDETYLNELGKYIMSQGFEVKVASEWENLPDGSVNYSDAKDVTLN